MLLASGRRAVRRPDRLRASRAATTSTALPWSIRRTIELLRGDAPTPDPLGRPDPLPVRNFDAVLDEVRALHDL